MRQNQRAVSFRSQLRRNSQGRLTNRVRVGRQGLDSVPWGSFRSYADVWSHVILLVAREVCLRSFTDVRLEAISWLQKLLSRVPRDPIAMLGFEQVQGKEQLTHNNFEN